MEEVNSAMFQKIREYLEKNSISYRALHHRPTRTSEESARARGENISIGGKALVMKIGESFRLFVLSASRKLDSSKVRGYFNTRKTRFATKEELFEMTGLEPGSVPPFGPPILELELYVDVSTAKNKRIAFNAGSLTDSVIMDVTDYMKLASPEVFDFSRPADE